MGAAPKISSLEKLDATLEEILRDPAKFKRESFERARRENPNLTEAQLQASWDQMADQLGL